MQECVIVKTQRQEKNLQEDYSLQRRECWQTGEGWGGSAMRLILQVLEKTANKFSSSYREDLLPPECRSFTV